jgi:hypothetical protein
LIAIVLKHKQPTRVGRLILENRRDNMKEKQYKKLLKKDPGGAMGAAYAGPWILMFSMKKDTKCELDYSVKKMGKHVTLLWPHQNKGRQSKNGGMGLQMLLPTIGKSMKVVDSLGWGGKEYADFLLKGA